MAVIKHISVKGSNGGDALNYVLYKHNEKTGELIVDGRGNPVMRDEYYLDGINCEPYSFAAECKEVNDLYGKNQLPGDIKAHHFIISYDPKDGVEHGLTGSKAQQLSMEWAQRCLPGFQILVCTHMDGSNESGNIHTHIMMNSVRKHDTQFDDFGERTIDHLAGYKLNLTKNHLLFMKQELMDLCGREGLYQIDLLSPAKDRITDKEYRAQQNGQNHIDRQYLKDNDNSERTAFQTQKQYLRDAVMDVAERATSFDAFCEIMKQEYNITVKESRGRISYLHPDREKYITGRALGTSYEKVSVIQIINGEIDAQISGRNKVGNREPLSIKVAEDCNKVFEMQTNLRLVVRLQDCAKARTSAAYSNRLTMSNVKAMAETILFVQQNGFDSVDALEKEIEKTEIERRKISKQILEKKEKQKEVNETIHYLGQYLSYKNEYQNYCRSRNKNEYKRAHEGELSKYTTAADYLKHRYADKPFPALVMLKEEKRHIKEELEKGQIQLNIMRKKIEKLRIAVNNIQVMCGENNSTIQAIYEKTRNGELKDNVSVVR